MKKYEDAKLRSTGILKDQKPRPRDRVQTIADELVREASNPSVVDPRKQATDHMN